jgi:hypothetical protein
VLVDCKMAKDFDMCQVAPQFDKLTQSGTSFFSQKLLCRVIILTLL